MKKIYSEELVAGWPENLRYEARVPVIRTYPTVYKFEDALSDCLCFMEKAVLMRDQELLFSMISDWCIQPLQNENEIAFHFCAKDYLAAQFVAMSKEKNRRTVNRLWYYVLHARDKGIANIDSRISYLVDHFLHNERNGSNTISPSW